MPGARPAVLCQQTAKTRFYRRGNIMQPLRLAVLSTSRIVDEFLQHLPEMPELCVTAPCCQIGRAHV